MKFALLIECLLLTAAMTSPSQLSSAEILPGADSGVVLQRIRGKVAANLSRLPNYTCHEVIDRLVRPPNVSDFVKQDRVEVEVAFVGNKELFARPGGSIFSEMPLSDLVPIGTVGTGNFGSHTHSIFVGEAASFNYIGVSKKDGRRAYRFDFQVPQAKSQFLVKHNGAQGIVAYHGSFWADVDTYDLLRVEIRADHIPPNIGVRFVSTKMRYAMMQFNDSEILLPRHSDLQATDSDGNYSVDGVTLERCREFRGDSAVTYTAPDSPPIERPLQ